MRKSFLFLCLLALALSSFAQVHFRKTFYKGDSVYVYPFPYYSWSYYDNPEMESYSGGDLKSSGGLFISSFALPEGRWIAYYNIPVISTASEQKEKVAMEFYCRNGMLDGPSVVYGRSGKIIANGNFKNGNKEGTWVIYSAGGKYLLEQLNYKNGVPEGDWDFYNEGKLRNRLHYKDGKRDGQQYAWFPDGKLKETAIYKEDRGAGPARTYYSNGKKAIECSFEDRQFTGWFREWSYKGTLIEETHYFDPKEARPTLISKSRDPRDTSRQFSVKSDSGFPINWQSILSSGKFMDQAGFQDGLSTSWWENGQLKNKSFYDFGKRIYGDTTYDNKGRISIIQKDSLAGPKKNLVSIQREFDPAGHVISYELDWKDSMSISKEFSSQGVLLNYKKIVEFPLHPTYLNDSADIIYLNLPDLIQESFEKNEKGFITQETHLNNVTKTYSDITRTGKGLLQFQTIQDHEKKQFLEYDKKGQLQTATYYTGYTGNDSASVNIEESETGNFDYSFLTDSVLSFKDNKPREGFARIRNDDDGFSEGNFSKGRYTGHWKKYEAGKQFTDHKRISEEADYVNNQLEGTKLEYTFCGYNYILYNSDKPFNYLSDKEEYHKGRLNGTTTRYNPLGKIIETCEYKNNILHGQACTYFSGGQMLSMVNYRNGLREGPAKRWIPNGTIIEDRNYTSGKKNGLLNTWYDNGILEMTGSYLMGRKVSNWIHYFKNGTKKADVHFRTEEEALEQLKSLHMDPKELKKQSHENVREDTDNLPETDVAGGNLEEHNAHLIYYYENSVKAQEGDIFDGSRIGTWTWWREDGSKEKEVDYTRGRFIHTPGDTLNYKGKYTSWYANGTKSLEALIMDESRKYDCSKEVLDLVQNLFYLNGWDNEGKPTIVNGTGYFKGIGAGGIVRSEGGVAGGVKQGPWQYRDENGNLTATGSYNEGMEEGKWLRGDLTGVHSIENACFRDADPTMLANLMKELEVEETWYHAGESWKSRTQSNKNQIFEKKVRFHPNREPYLRSFNILPNIHRRYYPREKF